MKQLINVCLWLFAVLLITPGASGQADGNYTLNTVVIDAGHGGKDPGALGKHTQEKDIALKIALKTGHYISKYLSDVEVIYTRKTDKFVELHERAEIANQNQADLFISVHVNALDNSRVKGTSTYVMGENKTNDNLKVAKLENSVILYEEDYMEQYEGYDPNSPENHIMFSLAVDTYREQSLSFASLTQNQFRERAMRKDLGVRQAGLVVLWQTTMPSVLVETGFITNRAEEKYLSSEYGQNIIASAIFRAFRTYKQKIDKKSSFSAPAAKPKPIEKPAESEESIRFYVQVMSLPEKRPENDPIFRGIDVKPIKIGNSYKYVTGETADPDQAIVNQRKIREKFPEAFVVAFKGDDRISFSQAVKAINP